MAPRDRSEGRDVYIYNIKDPNTILGGLILEKGVTNANFYSMVEILIIFESDLELKLEGNINIERNDNLLQPGNYYINSNSKLYTIVLLFLAN